MKLSNRAVNDLLMVVDHTRKNISWGEGGSFIDDEGAPDPKQVKSAERGIELIKRIILTRE